MMGRIWTKRIRGEEGGGRKRLTEMTQIKTEAGKAEPSTWMAFTTHERTNT